PAVVGIGEYGPGRRPRCQDDAVMQGQVGVRTDETVHWLLRGVQDLSPCRLRRETPILEPAMTEPLSAAAERPRERLLRHGPGVLTDAEILAVMLRTGTPGCNAVELGRRLLAQFGGLRALLSAGRDEMQRVPGLGQAKICQLLAVLELARRALEEDLARGRALDQPARVKQYCAAILGHRRVEHCLALYLDSQYRLIASEDIARGTLTQASVYPREVV